MAISSAEKSARYRAKDVDAYREKKRVYAATPEQRAKRTEYMRKYRELHREKTNEQARISHKNKRAQRTPESRHDSHLKSYYGINREQYLQMLEEQGGCAICGSKTSRSNKSFHVDHCHTTHKIRGLLCNRCNPMLGWYEANISAIEKYLKKDLSEMPEVKKPSKSISGRKTVSNAERAAKRKKSTDD